MTNSLMNENWMNRKESAEDILIRGGDVLTVSGLERGDVLMRGGAIAALGRDCLLYTSDAADEL